ncbi:MAG: hypothetical protein RI988_2381, partial [Pseudomonadota bacterium]
VVSAARLHDLYQTERASAGRVGSNLLLNLERLIQERLDALQVLAALGSGPAPEPLEAQYRHAQAFVWTFGSHVLLADMQRRMVFNTRVPLGSALPAVPVPEGRSAWDAVLATLQPAVGDVVQGAVAGAPIVTLAVPIVQDARVSGLLLNTLETAELQRYVDSWQLPPHVSLTLRDGTGWVLVHRGPSPGQAATGPAVQPLYRKAVARTPWSLEVAFDPSSLRGALLREVGQLVAGLALAVALVTYFARRAGQRLQRAVASLADEQAPHAGGPKPGELREVALARQRLHALTTQRTSAVEQARSSERRLLQLLRDFREPVWISMNRHIEFANAAAQRLAGANEATMRGRSILDFVEAASVERVRGLLDRVRAGEVDLLFEDIVFPMASPQARSLRVTGAVLELPEGQANLTIARDISELRLARNARERANRELLALVVRLNTAEEAERSRIARELHDDLQQHLGVITLEQERAASALPADTPAALAALARARDMTAASIESVRRIVRSLRPQALDELGLAAALDCLVHEFGKRHALQTECELIGPEGADAMLPEEAASSLYRIGQEALNNVHKHARASFVHVGLDLSRPGRATLFVVDDGVGIGAPAPLGEGAFGIRGMRERVRALGGTLEIGPEPGGGTRLEARVAWPVV